jgi:hypothetical protein
MWTGGTSPGHPLATPLTQIAPCANGKSRGPPGGSSGAKRHAPARPRAAVRLKRVNVNGEDV